MTQQQTDRNTEWGPESWKQFTALQQPQWPADSKPQKILTKLSSRLPLVFSGEVDLLKQKIALASEGKMFLLQGGDCAERFSPSLEEIKNKLKVLLQMNMVLMYAGAKPVIKVGRFAGQYAKPRSKPTETVDGVELPSYFGDIVNRPEPTAEARRPDPKNMLDAYNFSSSTLNIIRGLSDGGFTDLHLVHGWNKEFISNSPAGRHFAEIADGITKALDFMSACGIQSSETASTRFFTSHEALLLEYESALTRYVTDKAGWYDLSAHMVWLGDRTRDPQGAHVEFVRGIRNPLGIKTGPSLTEEQLLRLLQLLNPANEPGRITLITRYGSDKVADHLPSLIRTVEREGAKVLWSCDPMHGNTEVTSTGYKTRNFARVFSETRDFMEIHKAEGTVAGGIHLELTGEPVTECTGGADRLSEVSLEENYRTACDSRLNAKQAIELAFLIAKELS